MFLSKTDFSSYLYLPLVSTYVLYAVVFSYYLTVLNGYSLTALKSIEFTQCLGSFTWGGPSAFGIYMFSLCNGISLYFLII